MQLIIITPQKYVGNERACIRDHGIVLKTFLYSQGILCTLGLWSLADLPLHIILFKESSSSHCANPCVLVEVNVLLGRPDHCREEVAVYMLWIYEVAGVVSSTLWTMFLSLKHAVYVRDFYEMKIPDCWRPDRTFELASRAGTTNICTGTCCRELVFLVKEISRVRGSAYWLQFGKQVVRRLWLPLIKTNASF